MDLRNDSTALRILNRLLVEAIDIVPGEIPTVCIASLYALRNVRPAMRFNVSYIQSIPCSFMRDLPRSNFLDCAFQSLIFGSAPDAFVYVPGYFTPPLAAILVCPTRELGRYPVPIVKVSLTHCEAHRRQILT